MTVGHTNTQLITRQNIICNMLLSTPPCLMGKSLVLYYDRKGVVLVLTHFVFANNSQIMIAETIACPCITSLMLRVLSHWEKWHLCFDYGSSKWESNPSGIWNARLYLLRHFSDVWIKCVVRTSTREFCGKPESRGRLNFVTNNLFLMKR
jgi:hypothetical protein